MRKGLSLILPVVLLGIGLASCNSEEKQIICYTRDTTSGTRDGFFTGIGFSKYIIFFPLYVLIEYILILGFVFILSSV